MKKYGSTCTRMDKVISFIPFVSRVKLSLREFLVAEHSFVTQLLGCVIYSEFFSCCLFLFSSVIVKSQWYPWLGSAEEQAIVRESALSCCLINSCVLISLMYVNYVNTNKSEVLKYSLVFLFISYSVYSLFDFSAVSPLSNFNGAVYGHGVFLCWMHWFHGYCGLIFYLIYPCWYNKRGYLREEFKVVLLAWVLLEIFYIVLLLLGFYLG